MNRRATRIAVKRGVYLDVLVTSGRVKPLDGGPNRRRMIGLIFLKRQQFADLARVERVGARDRNAMEAMRRPSKSEAGPVPAPAPAGRSAGPKGRVWSWHSDAAPDSSYQ